MPFTAFFIFFKASTCRRATSNSRGGLFVWACVVVTKACDCLRELALTYPKLLTKSLGHLYKYLTRIIIIRLFTILF